MKDNRHFYKLRTLFRALIACLMISIVMPSCGTIRTYGGIEHDYEFDFDGHGHHHKKPKKHKHKKHKHHHHDHDDDDD